MLTSKLAIPVLGFSLGTQLRVLGGAGREADWLLPSTSSHFRGPRAACCRRQGNDLTRSPAIGSLQREEGPGSECVHDRRGHLHLSRPRPAEKRARARGQACRQPCGRSARGSSATPSNPGRRRWPPSCKGAALARPGPPRVRRSLPDSDWLALSSGAMIGSVPDHPAPSPGARRFGQLTSPHLQS